MDLARGHWALEEFDEAIECLLRVVSDSPETPGLAEMVGKYAIESQDARLAAAHESLTSQQGLSNGSPLHTGTMAKLLAEQGHASQALQVASEALNRNPEDERARELLAREAPASGPHDAAVEELERWLVRIRERRHRRLDA